ncbi:ABC transporter permease subunit [Natronosalvus rutilus]|uniref:ABC transporter permease n=1 Tax=Natronosalvus rutilus TaxID=2953753 RepID=A0A9E7SWB6_9EURY|nr:ABC transporter permease subunit [Natronosalvus rutilus]UTF54867.1 ABC transporter permease [Natronosalvus rutilus]
MSWMHIASKDFADAGRSMMLWALTVLLVLLVAGVSAIPYLLADGTTPTFEQALNFLFTPIGLLVPIIGLVVGYQAIVSERESGSIRFLLGLPNTRRDVVLGKVVGRAGVVAVPTLIGFLVGAVVIGALYDGFIVTDYLGLLVFSLIMGLVYVSVAVAISASVSSRAKALAGVLGFFVLFDFLWEFVPMAMYWAVEGNLPGFDGLPAWYLFVLRLSPGQALSALALTLIEFAGAGDLDLTAAGRVAGEVPFYLENWFAWIIVVLWITVPVSLGYLRFKNAILS